MAETTKKGGLVLTNLVRGVRAISKGGMAISGFLLFLLMFHITTDVTARFLFNSPIKGTLEISEVVLVVVVFLSVAFTQSAKAHVNADLLVSHFPLRVRLILDLIISFVGIAFFIFLTKQSVVSALSDLRSGLSTEILGIPIFPAKLVIGLGAILMIMQLFADALEDIKKFIEGE